MNAPAGWASYAYAVARSFDPAQLAGVRGVDGADVRLVRYRDLVAVVSPVPLTEFDEAALRTKLESLPWLEATARAHHAVVDVVAASSVTLPLRLATVYRGDERVTRSCGRAVGGFRAALDRLAGRVELGVKVYTDRPAMAPAAAPSALAGRDYLRRRRAEEAERGRLAAGGRHRRAGGRDLAGLAVDRPSAPAADVDSSLGRLARTSSTLAYLVDEGTHRGVRRTGRVPRRGAPGTRIELTGPWAPYSFALPRSTGEHRMNGNLAHRRRPGESTSRLAGAQRQHQRHRPAALGEPLQHQPGRQDHVQQLGQRPVAGADLVPDALVGVRLGGPVAVAYPGRISTVGRSDQSAKPPQKHGCTPTWASTPPGRSTRAASRSTAG